MGPLYAHGHELSRHTTLKTYLKYVKGDSRPHSASRADCRDAPHGRSRAATPLVTHLKQCTTTQSTESSPKVGAAARGRRAGRLRVPTWPPGWPPGWPQCVSSVPPAGMGACFRKQDPGAKEASAHPTACRTCGCTSIWGPGPAAGTPARLTPDQPLHLACLA